MKTKNWLILLFLVIAVIGIISGLFHLLGPEEKTLLFYVNMVVSTTLGIILLCNLPLFAGGKRISIRNMSISVQVYYFVLLEGLWMLLYNLGLSGSVTEEYCYGGMLIILLLFIVLIGTVGIGGNIQQENQDVIERSISTRKNHLASTQLVLLEYQQATVGINGLNH